MVQAHLGAFFFSFTIFLKILFNDESISYIKLTNNNEKKKIYIKYTMQELKKKKKKIKKNKRKK